eukprot:SAG11_NODE_6181_length_1370_cov_1.682927_2_plen_108_part_00
MNAAHTLALKVRPPLSMVTVQPLGRCKCRATLLGRVQAPLLARDFRHLRSMHLGRPLQLLRAPLCWPSLALFDHAHRDKLHGSELIDQAAHQSCRALTSHIFAPTGT